MKRTLALASIVALLAGPAQATPWHTLGPRAMGMGGAQVAIAQGPLASYWNPAGLGQLYNTTGFESVLSGRLEASGSVIEGANDLNAVNSDCSKVPVGPNCTQANLTAALAKLGQPGNGAMADAGVSVDVKIKRVVLFVRGLGYAGATPSVDLTNTTIATIANNQSKLVLRGGSFTEMGVGYGQEILESGLTLGATGKLIVGRIGYYEQRIVTEDPDGANVFDDFDRNSKTSTQASFDLGALWDLRETFPVLPMRPRLGVVGRNINNPKFTQPAAALAAGDRGHYRLNGLARAGVALSPLKFWNLAADVDLTDNITPIDGLRSRFLSVGTEINVFNRPNFNIPLRAGLQKNISQKSNDAVAYTAGFGLNFVHVMLDVAGMVSSQRTQLQSVGQNERIPNNAAISARFAFLFGGVDEGARNK